MLLKFSVTNFLSIRDEAELSFVAAPLKDRREILIPSPHTAHGVLPVLAVYGANASGKSNTLAAFSYLRWFVVNSFKRADEDGTGIKPFLLDDESAHNTSRFVLDFVHDRIRYQFGMALSKHAITSEWLFQFPKNARQVLYEREGDFFKFGRALQGSNRQIQSITRKNALFLSAAATSNHPELTRIHEYFRDRLMFQGGNAPEVLGERAAVEIESDEDLQKQLVRHLALADTGIAAIKVDREQIPEAIRAELQQLTEAVKKLVGELPSGRQLPSNDVSVILRLGHTGGDGKIHFLDFGDESMGTKYLMKLLPSMLRALKAGSVLILDEITTGLHTLLARQLVDLFHDRKINALGAQLIFSTHDTNLLAPGVMRRDEIWFAEKGRDGVTTLFPLTDIRTKNSDNIERGYIQGRFGAVPVLPQPRKEPA